MKIFFKLLSIIIMILIIYFSDQPADISSKQSDFIYDLLGIDFESMGVDIRKIAHLTIYMSLGFSLICSFFKVDKKIIIMVFLGIFLFACSDELHQTFVPGRGGRFLDVIIDCTGGMIGIIFANGKFKQEKAKKIITKKS